MFAGLRRVFYTSDRWYAALRPARLRRVARNVRPAAPCRGQRADALTLLVAPGTRTQTVEARLADAAIRWLTVYLAAFERRRDRLRRCQKTGSTLRGCSARTTLNNELWTSRWPL